MKKESTLHKIEHTLEWLIFNSRWLLSVMYLVLLITLAFILLRFGWDLYQFILSIFTFEDNEWIIRALELLDLTLIANLIIIVAFSGYENFVSPIDVADENMNRLENKSKRLSWMGQLDFSGLKLKIIGSIVAISIIELLQDFFKVPSGIDPNVEFWRIILHLTFVVTGAVFASMELLSQKRHQLKEEDKKSELIEL